MGKRSIYFIQCGKCGEWRYTTKVVKTVKCLNCGKSICFPKAKKEIYEVEALKFVPELLKRIKMQNAIEKDPEVKKEFEQMYGE